MRASLLCLAATLGVAPPALAQESEDFDGSAFSLDLVFVSPFHVEADSLRPQAEALSEELLAALSESNLVVGIEDIAPFEDYGADIYLEACPPGNYLGCVYVLADRGEADWGVGGELRSTEQGLQATISFLDVAEARVVFAFSATVGEQSQAAFVDGVAQTMSWLLSGAADSEDLRGEVEDAREAWEAGRLENADIARMLEGLEEDLGAMLEVGRMTIDPPRLTVADLARYQEDDARNPWDLVGMNQAQYLRYRNSGMHLEAWRELAFGRARSVVLRAAGGLGSGPYEHAYDVRYVLGLVDGVYTELEIATRQELRNGTGGMGLFELGFGILPWLEVDATLKLRSGRFSYFQHQEVQGDNNTLLKEPTDVPISSRQFGGRLVLAPMPTYLLRPTLGAGLSLWQGARVEETWGVPDFAPTFGTPSLVVFETSPGIELDPGGPVLLFARADIGLAFGTRQWEAHEGQDLLQNPVSPVGSSPLGVDVLAGLAVVLGPIGGVPEPRIEEDSWEP